MSSSDAQSTYQRIASHVKAFEPVNASNHQFIGNHAVDLADLDTYTGITKFSLDVPEGTPVEVTSTGLKIIDGAATSVPNMMGYLVQNSRFFVKPFRRDNRDFGWSGSARDKVKADNIQYIRVHEFRAIYQYYVPKVANLNDANAFGATISSSDQPAVGDFIVIRDKTAVVAELTSGLWDGADGKDLPVPGVINSMPPVVQLKASTAPLDIVIGQVSDVREIDTLYPMDTGIYLKGRTGTSDVNEIVNYLKMEIMVDMFKPFIAT